MGSPVPPDLEMLARIDAAEPYDIPAATRERIRRYQDRLLGDDERAAVRAQLREDLPIPPANLAAAIRVADTMPELDYLGLQLEYRDTDARYALALIADPDPLVLARAAVARCARGPGLDAFLSRRETRSDPLVIRAGVEALSTAPGRAITDWLREVCMLPATPEHVRIRAAHALAYRWELFTLGEALAGGEERVRPGRDPNDAIGAIAFAHRLGQSGWLETATRLRTDPDERPLSSVPLSAPGANIHTLRAAVERALLGPPQVRVRVAEAVVSTLDEPLACPRFRAWLAPWVGGWPTPAPRWRCSAMHAGHVKCAEDLRLALTRDSSPELRDLAASIATLDSAVPMPPTGVMPDHDLVQALSEGGDDTRRAAIAAASWQPGPLTAAALAEIVRLGRRSERPLAIYALGADPSEIAERALTTATTDPSITVRRCALAALTARSSPHAYAALTLARAEADEGTRALAFVLLARLDVPEARADFSRALLDLLERAEAAISEPSVQA